MRERYHAYLASRAWAEIRNQVRLRARGRCERCAFGIGTSAHHTTYARLYSERITADPRTSDVARCEPSDRLSRIQKQSAMIWAAVPLLGAAQMIETSGRDRLMPAKTTPSTRLPA